jgi:hypothetical protein
MFRLQEVIVRPLLEHENLKLQWWSVHVIPVLQMFGQTEIEKESKLN